jgi:AcrR family transcriptional regulator
MSAHIHRDASAGQPRNTTWGTGRLDDIVDAALTLFADQGYLGTSMKDIAAALGLRAPIL